MDSQLFSTAMGYLLIIGLGSEGIYTVLKLMKEAEHRGTPIKHGENSWLILVDDHLFSFRDLETDPLTSCSPSDLSSAFVQIGLVDKESRRHLYESGRLGFLGKQAVEDPGVCTDRLGTGNRPVWGRALIRMNEKTIERRIIQGIQGYLDHDRLRGEALKGKGVDSHQALHIPIYFSPVGGLGGGALREVCRIVRRCARQLHITVRIHLIAIDLGTLYPANREVAIENRNRLMNGLRVEATGAYHDLEGLDEDADGPLFDSLMITPNAGFHSQFSTLADQEWFVAGQSYLRFYSPMSHRLNEDAVDVNAHAGQDETGAPCIGSAMGTYMIALLRNVYRAFCANATISSLIHTILRSPSDDEVPQARQAAGELHLVESYGESHTTRHLTQASGNDPDAFQEAQGGFADRVTGLSGIAASQAMVASLDWVMNELVPSQQPRMHRRAAGIVERLQERTSREKAARANDLTGLCRIHRWVSEVSNSVGESDVVNSEHLASLIEHREATSQRLDACRQVLQAYPRKNLLGRILGWFSFRIAMHRFRKLAERAVSLEVEHAARTLAQEEVFLPARKLLAGELERLTELAKRVEEAGGDASRAAEAILKAQPAPYEVPMGVGLGDEVCLKHFYGATVEKKGGETELIEQVRAAVLEGKASLLEVLDQPKEELAERLAAAARGLFEPDIASLNVLNVFRERYRDAITSILTEAVLNSRPWIRTVGEAERDIPVVKLVGVPEGCDEKWVMDQLKKVDHSEGGWEVVKLPETYDDIIFLTYRSGVSLTMLIDQQRSSMGEGDPEWCVRNAANPLAASIPSGKLTDSQARIVACLAYSLGLLTRHKTDGWVLNAVNGEPAVIGREPSSVVSFFQMNCGEVVHVYSALGDSLRAHGTALSDKLRQLEKTWTQDNNLRGLLDDGAVHRALEETRRLLPFAKAMGRKEREQ